MAPEPKPERLRLVIEPDKDDTRILRADRDDDAGTARREIDDLVELDRLADDEEYPFEDEEEPEQRRSALPVILATTALLGFAAVSWYAYQGVTEMSTEEAIPVIQADASPIKTRPTAPGGLDVPHQDKLVLNEITPDPEKPQVERLLPPPEVPKPPSADATVPAGAVQGGNTATDAANALAGTQETAKTEAVPLETAAGPTTQQPAPQAQAPQQQSETAPRPAPAVPVVQAPAATPPDATKSAPAAPTTAAAPPAPAVPKAETSAPKAEQTAALTHGYMVQLASLKDKNLVGGEWVRLQKAFPAQLDDKRLVLQSADLGTKGVYHRLRVGYYKDQASAASACQAFKAQNQDCIVVRP